MIVLFFANAGQVFFAKLGPHWSYIVDQSGLVIIAVLALAIWLKRHQHFRLRAVDVALIALVTLAAHLQSLDRSFFAHDWINLLNPIASLAQDPAAAVGPFFSNREIYAWWPFTLIYLLVGIGRPFSLIAFNIAAVGAIIGVALAGGWLAGVVSGRRAAAIITGLLLAASPTSFASLPWHSNVLGDSIGIMLTCLMVGAWFIARKSDDRIGIVIALLLLAATLKGGSVVRTAMVGFLLVLVDLIFLRPLFGKREWLAWFAVAAVSLGYYIVTPAAHWKGSAGIAYLVRFGYLFDGVTHAIYPPTLLAPLLKSLYVLKNDVPWTIVLGLTTAVLGTVAAVWLIKHRWLKIFSFGWFWFWLTIWFVPWLAFDVAFLKDLSRIQYNVDWLFAGYKYAYLPLVGLVVAAGVIGAVFLDRLRTAKRTIFLVAFAALIVFRFVEFVWLEDNWQKNYAKPRNAVYHKLLAVVPPSSVSSDAKAILLVADGRDRFEVDTELKRDIIPVLYPGQSLLLVEDARLLPDTITNFNIPINNVFAIGWDSGSQQSVNLTELSRNWLKDPNKVSQHITDFTGWYSNVKVQNGTLGSEFNKRGTRTIIKEPLMVSSELALALPSKMRITIKAELAEIAQRELPEQGAHRDRVVISRDSAHQLFLPRDFWNDLLPQWYPGREQELLNHKLLSSDDTFEPAMNLHNQPVRFVIAALCQTPHDKLEVGEFSFDQSLSFVELAKGQTTLTSSTRTGPVTLQAPLYCNGPRLRRLIIVGPTTVSFKLERIIIDFPY